MNLHYSFNPEKNKKLIAQRGISFEEIIASITSGGLLDILEHSNKENYANQEIYVVQIDEEVYAVPTVTEGDQVFLKTVFPSRKLRKQYLG